MIEREVRIETVDGLMPALTVRPDVRPAKAVIVMLMDGRGVREALRDHARRLATSGYYVILPNLFYRRLGQGPTEDVKDADWMTVLNSDITPARIAEDIEACLGVSEVEVAELKGRPAGLIGYCMGARLAVTGAQRLGARIGAVAALHPGYMATRRPESPHLHLDAIKAEIYFGLPEHDVHLSPAAVAKLRDALDANGVDYRLEVIARVEHGFTVPGNDTYDKPAAERAWEQALALFDRTIGQAATTAG